MRKLKEVNINTTPSESYNERHSEVISYFNIGRTSRYIKVLLVA